MNPPSLLILSGVRGDTRRYRSLHLAEQATLAGLQVTLAHAWQGGLTRLVKRNHFDIAVFQRVEMDKFIAHLVEVLRVKGTLILYDTDDLVFDRDAFKYIDSPDFSDSLRRKLYLGSMYRQKAMLLASDGVLVSTSFMVRQVRRLNKPVWVHSNAFSAEMLDLSKAAMTDHIIDPWRFVMGYASGTRTHDRDFALVVPAIKQILAQYPQTELWLIGEVDPGTGWESFSDRMRCIPKVPWHELPAWLVQFDVNLAPLVAGNPFAESKSAIKYMEAALVRCPTIASACAEFKETIMDGENGFLSSNVNEWLQKLVRLVEDPQLRLAMGQKAYSAVLESANPLQRSRKLLTTLQTISLELGGTPLMGELTDADEKSSFSMSFTWQEAPNDMQRGWVTLWRRGPLEVLGGLWLGLRRLLVPLFPIRKRRPIKD